MPVVYTDNLIFHYWLNRLKIKKGKNGTLCQTLRHSHDHFIFYIIITLCSTVLSTILCGWYKRMICCVSCFCCSACSWPAWLKEIEWNAKPRVKRGGVHRVGTAAAAFTSKLACVNSIGLLNKFIHLYKFETQLL